jgi:hypothetical protein
LIGEVLYHEIGHHIHRTKRHDRRDKEFVADEWGEKLLRSFMTRRYWYVSYVTVPLRPLLRLALTRLKRKDKEERVS